nr:retrovirus-related Pol polyprotein from transposon TNT 1-94 [Ipomoea batatas]
MASEPSNKETKSEKNATITYVASSYALNSNDNPGSLITQVQLKGENYDEWVKAIRIALRAKKKFDFTDGSIQQPAEDSPDLEDWWQNGELIANYFGRLKLLWDELNNLERLPVCTCGGCKCSLSTQWEKRKEEERVHQFLMGLDGEQYNTIRSNVLSQDLLPNLNRVYHMVVQDEQARTIVSTHDNRSNLGTQQQTRQGKCATIRVNVAQATVGETPSQAVSMTNTEQTAIGGLSNEQWGALLAALSIHKPKANQRLSGNLP